MRAHLLFSIFLLSGLTALGQTDNNCVQVYTAEMTPIRKQFGGQKVVLEEQKCTLAGDTFERRLLYKKGDTLLAQETLRFLNDKWVEYSIQQEQVKYTARLERTRGSAKSTVKTGNQTQTSSFKNDVIVGPMLTDIIVQNWSALREKKETVSILLFVPHRNAAYDFEIKWRGDKSSKEKNTCAFELAGKIIFVRMAVEPAVFTFACDTQQLREEVGRYPAQVKDGSTYREADWRAIYSYPK